MANANYGLLDTMASGIKEGLIAYQTTNALQRQQNQFNLLNGTEDDGNGGIRYTATKQAQIDSQNQGLLAKNKAAQDELDPNSDASKSGRDFASQITGKDIPENISASQLKEYSPLAVAGLKADTSSDNAELNAEAKREAIAASKANRAGKDADAQEKTYTEMSNKAVGGRGAPAGVQQASKALVNIGNAKDLINQYPDLDQMPPAQVHQLNEELGKIATGGVATGASSAGTNTFRSNLQSFMEKVGNEPTGAQLGAFIQNNKNYLDALETSNKGVQDNYSRAVYNAYKNRLSPDQRNRFETLDKPELFQNQQQGADAGSASSGGLIGKGSQANSGGTQPAHPQDTAAIQWAQENPKDPRSAAILKANGM